MHNRSTAIFYGKDVKDWLSNVNDSSCGYSLTYWYIQGVVNRKHKDKDLHIQSDFYDIIVVYSIEERGKGDITSEFDAKRWWRMRFEGNHQIIYEERKERIFQWFTTMMVYLDVISFQ